MSPLTRCAPESPEMAGFSTIIAVLDVASTSAKYRMGRVPLVINVKKILKTDDSPLAELRRSVWQIVQGAECGSPALLLAQYLDVAAVDSFEVTTPLYRYARDLLHHMVVTCAEAYSVLKQIAGRSWALTDLMDDLEWRTSTEHAWERSGFADLRQNSPSSFAVL